VAGSTLLDVFGKIKYIHAVNFNKYGDWAITIYPDVKSLEIIRDYQAKGWKNVMKKDDTGYYIQFKRPPTKAMKGKLVAFTAPKIVDMEGTPFDGNRVGWGSDAIVRLEVYQHGTPNGGKAYACRWDSAKITNLIPFDMDKSDWSEEDKENIKDLATVPEPEQPW
jgi:hypothetical protein